MGILQAQCWLSLDFAHTDFGRVLECAELFRNRVYGYKVHVVVEGRLETRIATLRTKMRPIWWDRKILDTPNTAHGIGCLARDAGVDVITAHTDGGIKMLSAIKSTGITVYGVTELTSVEPVRISGAGGFEHTAIGGVFTARQAGLDGITCPVGALPTINALRFEESGASRALFRNFTVLVPGTRTFGEHAHGHAQTGTAPEAIRLGADYLVLGREVTEAEDPLAMFDQIERAIEDSLAANDEPQT